MNLFQVIVWKVTYVYTYLQITNYQSSFRIFITYIHTLRIVFAFVWSDCTWGWKSKFSLVSFFIKPRVRVYLYVAYSDSSFYYNQSFIYYFHVKRKRWKTKSSSNPFWYVTSYSTHILFTSRISEWKLLRFPATTM